MNRPVIVTAVSLVIWTSVLAWGADPQVQTPAMPVRVAAISFVPKKFDLCGNAGRLEQLFREAKAGGAKLAVSVEGALEGYVVNEIIAGDAPAERMKDVALPIDHEVIQRFQKLAAELEMCLVFGFAERIEDDVFNSAVFIDHEGVIRGKQHKMQLAEGYHESWWFNRLGAQNRAFDTPLGRCGILICNDRWNADLARIPVLDGARLLIIPSMGSRSTEQDEAVLSRGRENGVPVVEANLGVTLVVNEGEIIAVDREEEGITFGTITIPPVVETSPREREEQEQKFLDWRDQEMPVRYEKRMEEVRRKQDSVVLVDSATGQEPWLIVSPADWTEAEAASDNVEIENAAVILKSAGEGEWTSQWHDWQEPVDSATIQVAAEMRLFPNKTIETVIKGSDIPYTNSDGVPNDWYGRCMIAVVDEHRWIMALRSGIDHISWGKRDTIHLITSSDEGRTWGKLNCWFDGTPIEGMPYEDGNTHSEPGLYRMPNGDLILQFWKDRHLAGTKQLRSVDNGKTWVTDIERIRVTGMTDMPELEDRAIGTEGHFVDPENPSDVYMAFQFYHLSRISTKFSTVGGSILARSRDNGKSYEFLSWIAPTSCGNYEPAIEYVGNRTIVAVLRCDQDLRTWQAKSTDMGASFSAPVDISAQISGGVPNGLWQRARLYKESNPFFQHHNRLDYARGEGRLWGFGIHSMGGGYTRKPVVYWSDDNGESWSGPELLHGPMHPGTDTGYGDLKRRGDGTFVAATYYCPPSDVDTADLEQYTFGDVRAKAMIEADRDGDGTPDVASDWRELYNGPNDNEISGLKANLWRLRLILSSTDAAASPRIRKVNIIPR